MVDTGVFATQFLKHNASRDETTPKSSRGRESLCHHWKKLLKKGIPAHERRVSVVIVLWQLNTATGGGIDVGIE